MLLDFVPHSGGDVGAGDDAKLVRRAVVRLQHLCDIVRGLGKRQPRAVHALDANGFAIGRFVLADTPNIASEVATGLSVPFQGSPLLASPVVGENEALKLGAVKILKMYSLDQAGKRP